MPQIIKLLYKIFKFMTLNEKKIYNILSKLLYSNIVFCFNLEKKIINSKYKEKINY